MYSVGVFFIVLAAFVIDLSKIHYHEDACVVRIGS
jgi:hypothetical protein